MENNFKPQLLEFCNPSFPEFGEILYPNAKIDSIFFSCLVGLLEIICRGKSKNSAYAGNISELFKTYLRAKTDFSENDLIIQGQSALNQVIELFSDDKYSHSTLIEWLWHYTLPGSFCQNTFLIFAFKNMIFGRKLSKRLYNKLVNLELIDYEDANEILDNVSEMFGVYIDLIDKSGRIREINKSFKSISPRITIIQYEEFNYCLARYNKLKDYDISEDNFIDLLKPPFVVANTEETDLNNSVYIDMSGIRNESISGFNENPNLSLLSQAESIKADLGIREANFSYSFSASSGQQSSVNTVVKSDKKSFLSPGYESVDVKSVQSGESKIGEVYLRNGENFESDSSLGVKNVRHFNEKLRKEMEFVERAGGSRTVNRNLHIIEGSDPEFEKNYRNKLSGSSLKEDIPDIDIDEFYELAQLSYDLINKLNQKATPSPQALTKIKNISEKLIGQIKSGNTRKLKKRLNEIYCKKCGKSNNREDFEIFECGLSCLICFECRRAFKSSYCEFCNRSFTNYEKNVLKTISKP